MSHIERMTIALPVEMAALVKQAVEQGDYASSSEVFRDAIRDWRHKRQLQGQEIERVKSALAEGRADIEAGRLLPAEEVFRKLEAKYKDKQ